MDNLKNVVVLKNLPSNMIEEAIVIFKNGKFVKETNLVEKKNLNKKEENVMSKNQYIVREAESVVSNYIKNIEENKKDTKSLQQKYNKLKKYTCVVSIISIISIILNIFL